MHVFDRKVVQPANFAPPKMFFMHAWCALGIGVKCWRFAGKCRTCKGIPPISPCIWKSTKESVETQVPSYREQLLQPRHARTKMRNRTTCLVSTSGSRTKPCIRRVRAPKYHKRNYHYFVGKIVVTSVAMTNCTKAKLLLFQESIVIKSGFF